MLVRLSSHSSIIPFFLQPSSKLVRSPTNAILSANVFEYGFLFSLFSSIGCFKCRSPRTPAWTNERGTNNASKIWKWNYAKYHDVVSSLVSPPPLDCFQLDRDREEIIEQKHLLHEQIKRLEEQIHEQSFTIAQFNQELNDQKSTSAKLRYLSEEAEDLVQENQRQLNFKQDELRSQEEKILRLEKKICRSDGAMIVVENWLRFLFADDLQEVNQNLKDDFHRSRATVQTLDTERDRLSNELDLKSEENLHLVQELNAKTRQIEELNLNLAELDGSLE